METIIQITIDVILFLIASYFLFYKSFLKELGKQNAQLTTIEEKTKIIEDVKVVFTKEIEALRSELQKKNLEYQINQTELTKKRFERIDNLYIELINLQQFVQSNLFYFNDEEDYLNKSKKFKEAYELANSAKFKCLIYISNELKQKITDVLNGAYSAFNLFNGLYHTDTRKFGEVSIFNLPKQELFVKLANENIDYLEKIEKQINKLPELLNSLEIELKKQVILKNIE